MNVTLREGTSAAASVPPRSLARRLAYGVTALAVTAIAGCGSSASSSVSSPYPPISTVPVTTPAASTTTTSAATTTTSALTAATSASAPTTTTAPGETGGEIGTITQTGSGTEVTEDVTLGSIGYGTAAAPPSEVLDGLSNQNDALPSIIAGSAYVHGQLTLSYDQGSLPANLELGGLGGFARVGSGAPLDASVSFFSDGQWVDGSASNISIELQPGQSSTYEFWMIMPLAISNASPEISQENLETTAFHVIPAVDQIQQGGDGVVTVSGPQAATCSDGNHYLLPFAQLPFTIAGGSGADITCKAGQGVETY